jgi:uncharacterized protein (DUF849 family)
MEKKVAITAALNGGLTRKGEGRGMTPYVPITPDEVALEAERCYNAGASIVHIHARDPKTQMATCDLGIYKETVEKIKDKCPILINITTGGGIGQTLEERIAPVSALKPDMASYTSGSVSFGMYSKTAGKFIYDIAFPLTFEDMFHFAKVMQENGVKPECEIYQNAMLNNIKIVQDAGYFDDPIHLQFVLGMPGQVTPSSPRNLLDLVDCAKRMFPAMTWSVCAVSLDQWPMIALGAILGAENIRTGMEDNMYIEPGELAVSNAQMVEKTVSLATGVGREIATVEETRKLLQIS